MSPQLPGAQRPLTPARYLLAGLLVLILFAVGVSPEPVFTILTQAWQSLLEGLGLTSVLARWQQGTSSLVTTRSLPVVATYTLAYLGLCLLLLHVLLRDGRRTRHAAQVYLGLLGLYVVLLVAGRLAGNIPWVLKLSRRIIDFAVSPLPVMILLPMLWPGARRVLK